jgi:hypothetical protein
MGISSIIYYIICIILLVGAVLLLKESYDREIIRAKRWRLKVERIRYKEFPIIRLYYSFLEKDRREKSEVEIYEAVSFMRNIIVIGEGKSLSSDMLIEQLILRKGYLLPTYSGMLHLLRQNQRDEALMYFTDFLSIKISEDFARLLIQWDEIEPKQLQETLISLQNSIREARLTSLKKRDEAISDLIYLPVVINIILVFLNFIYVGYFIDQKEMLTMLL